MFDRDRRLFAKPRSAEGDETSSPTAKPRSHRFGKEDAGPAPAVETKAAPSSAVADQSNASAVAAFEQAEKQYAAKDYRGALVGYTTAWEASVIPAGERGQVAYDIAQCHRMLRHNDAAIAWYQSALASGGVEARRMEIDAHIKAMEAYADANISANAKFLEGEEHMKTKQYAKAAAAYLAAWEAPDLSNDQRGSLAVNRAQCLKLLGDTDGAIIWFELALSIGGPSVDASRATLEDILGGLRGAAPDGDKEHMRAKAGAKAEAKSEARFTQAEALYRKGAWSKSAAAYLDVWETAVVTAENRGSIAYNVAQCYRHEEHFGKAITWYELALKSGGPLVEPIRPTIEANLATAKQKFEAGETKAASKEDAAGKTAVRAQRSDEARKTFEAAEAAYQAADYVTAIALYKEVWETNLAEQGTIAFNIGQAYKKLGRSPQALAWYEDALAEGAFEPALEEIVVNIINDLRQQIGLAPRE